MSRSSRSRRPDGGFTLMELMVTMAISATLMGMGAGLFLSMGKRTASDNALAGISSLIANVKNASSRFPAMLVVSPTRDATATSEAFAGSVQAMAQEVRQELHFDSRQMEGQLTRVYEMGIEGRDCNPMGNTCEDNIGRVGGGIRLGGGKIDCGQYPAYDVTDGMTIELWMKPDSAGSADLVSKGEGLRVRLEAGSRISVTVQVEDEHGAEKVTLATPIPAVRPNRWMGVRVAYDCTALSIATDEGFGWVVRASKPETRRLAPSRDSNLLVGGFSGIMDDFRFAGVHSTEPVMMPQGVRLVGKKPQTIRFIGGRLDPAFHSSPARMEIETAGRRTTLEIAQNGSLSVAYTDAAVEAPKTGPDQPTGPAKKE
jgi:prepilin-type N-terminal cleavage/methylation domain-containing protein